MSKKIKDTLADLQTIKNILQESSPHEEIDGHHTRPVNCKCGYCLMETIATRSYMRLKP